MLKPITVRLPEEDLELARREAETLGISVGVYLRMVFRQSLRQRAGSDLARKAAAIRFMSEAMSIEAAEKGYTEDDLLHLSKEARKRLAAERRAASIDEPA
jgi:hypothetical protein